MSFYFKRHFALIYFIFRQGFDGVVVNTLAFLAGDPGSIPPLDQHTFNLLLSPSYPSGVTKPSSLKLATWPHESPIHRMLREESHLTTIGGPWYIW